MLINIPQLLQELFDYTQRTKVPSLSMEANDILDIMHTEFRRVQQSNEANKQKKLITILMGGIILTLSQDDYEYGHVYHDILYPRNTVTKASKKVGNRPISWKDWMYLVGEEALLDLPGAFCGAIFKIKTNLIGRQGEPRAFFPDLCENAHQVDILTHFCNSNKENLELTNIELDEAPEYEFPDSFVQEFIQRHQQSYRSGCFGGFFNRTNLKPYNELSVKDVLTHAKKTTFFGYNNRTCTILQEMNIIDENKEIIYVPANQG